MIEVTLMIGGQPLVAELDGAAIAQIAAAITQQQPEPEPNEWLDTQAAAQHLGCSTERLRKLVARRQIPFTQEGPRCRISFERAALDEWMRAGRIEPKPRVS